MKNIRKNRYRLIHGVTPISDSKISVSFFNRSQKNCTAYARIWKKRNVLFCPSFV